MPRQAPLVIFALVVLALLVWYAATHPVSPAPLAPTAQNSEIASYSEDEPYYSIEAHWPSATGLPGGGPAAVLLMKVWVQDTILEFKKNGNYANLTPEDIEMQGFNDGRKHTLDIEYLTTASPRTLSYIYSIYVDTGGAHPNLYFKTFTFDERTGSHLTLADLFTGNYLAELSRVSRAKLPDVIGEYADTEYIAEGTTPEEQNFETFFFDGEHFVLLFPPYQVGPYALGPVTLRIPATDLPLRSEYP